MEPCIPSFQCRRRCCVEKGLSQTSQKAETTQHTVAFSRFVNLLKSEEVPEQIILLVDGPLAGKSEAFAQPQHRFEPGDRPSRRFE